MSDTELTLIIKEVSQTAQKLVSTDQSDTGTVRSILHEFEIAIDDISQPSDNALQDPDIVGDYILYLESSAYQIVIHGDPDLGGMTPEDVFTESLSKLKDFKSGKITLDELISHQQEINSHVLTHRPETDVIGEYNLKPVFDNSVQRMLNEKRSTNDSE